MDEASLHIQKIMNIDLPLAEEINTICRPVKFSANTIIQPSGVHDTKGIFMLKGATKYSVFDDLGNEYVSGFDQAECFLAYGGFGFYRKNESYVNFIALSDVEGLEINSDHLMPIVDRNPKLYAFFINAIIDRYLSAQSKEINTIQKTSTERYVDFIEEYKEFIDDIPLKDIASYLHIKPGSLSRIRKNLNT